MKIILTQDVEKLGKSGEIKEIAPGYARNYLIPQKLAEIATEGAIKKSLLLQKARIKKEKELEKKASNLTGLLKKQTFNITAKADKTGKLFGSVTPKEIISIINKKIDLKDLKISDESIQLKEPIRKVGDYKIKINLFKNIQAQIKIKVIPVK